MQSTLSFPHNKNLQEKQIKRYKSTSSLSWLPNMPHYHGSWLSKMPLVKDLFIKFVKEFFRILTVHYISLIYILRRSTLYED